MKHLRLWILGAALGSFAAGMNVGLAIPNILAGETGSAGFDADRDYVQRLVARYGLTPEQERSLRLVMQAEREEKMQAWASAEVAQLPAALQNRLVAASRKSEQRLRKLMTAEQRARYDIDSRPQQAR